MFQMSQDQCIKTLEEHARIEPLVTLTGTFIKFVTLHLHFLLHIIYDSICMFLVQCGESCKKRMRSSLEHITFQLVILKGNIGNDDQPSEMDIWMNSVTI